MAYLQQFSADLLEKTNLDFQRHLIEKINWKHRLIGIKGARGTGKTTLMLQYLKQLNLAANEGLYITLDDIYFSSNYLKDTAYEFYRNGGKLLLIDEVHKYPGWSREVKNIYDLIPELKVIFTGSSIIDIARQEGDLSRRAAMYELPGLSYREYLSMRGIATLPVLSIKDIIGQATGKPLQLPADFRPLQHFADYLEYGYYPFTIASPDMMRHQVSQMVRTIVEYDMAELKDFDIRNAHKMLRLMYIIAQQVPFQVNLTKLASDSGIHRNSVSNYLHYLEQARLISLLYPAELVFPSLQKPEKIFLSNTTTLNGLAEDKKSEGTIRETFMLSQLCVNHKVGLPKKGDFLVDKKYTLEVGGSSKKQKQIQGIPDSYIVRADVIVPSGNVLPMWMFGLLY